MKKKLQKIFATLMTISMLMSLLSVTAFAEGESPAPELPPEGPAVTYENKDQIQESDDTEDGYAYYEVKKSGREEVASAFNSAENKAGNSSVTISKTITPTDTENEFDIQLKVQTTENFQDLELSPDAAVVLVLDVSGSMKRDMNGSGWCQEKDCDHYLEYVPGAKAPCHSDHVWAIDPETGENTSRVYLMAESLERFLDNYAADADGAKRMLSIATFNHNAQIALDWVDVAETEGMRSAQAVVNYDALTADPPRGNTAQGKGLVEATTLLADDMYKDAVADIPSRYVVLLTDGRPEGAYGEDSYTDSEGNTVTTDAKTDNVSGAHTERKAAELVSETNALISVIGFGTSTFTMYDEDETPVNDWLKNRVASSPSLFAPADSEDDLDLGLGKLLRTIQDVAHAWQVTDPMGEYIIYEGLIDDSGHVSFDEKENQIVWDLKNETPDSVEDGVYTYTKSYRIRLNTAADGFKFGHPYSANGVTTLSYFFENEVVDEHGRVIISNNSPIRDIDFRVPAVMGMEGAFAFRKVDSKTGEPMAGVKFTLTHDEDCDICGRDASEWSKNVESDKNGIVSFEGIPSGHSFKMTETTPDGYEDNEATYAVTVALDEELKNVETKVNGLNTVTAEQLAPVSTPVEGSEGEVAVTYPEFDDTYFYQVENTPKAQLTITKAVTGTDATETAPGKTFEAGAFEIAVIRDGDREHPVATVSLPKNVDGELVWSETVTKLDAGTYTVEELNTGSFNEDFMTSGYSWTGVTYQYGENSEAVNLSLSGGMEESVTVTNSYEYTPDYIPISATKIWKDDSNRDGIRPIGVIFGLFIGSENVGNPKEQILFADDNRQETTFTYNPRLGDAELREIGYVVAGEEEGTYENVYEEIPGYTADTSKTTVSDTDTTASITNEHEPETVQLQVFKQWEEGALKKMKPVTVDILANGKVIETVIIAAPEVEEPETPAEGEAPAEEEEEELVAPVIWPGEIITEVKGEPLYKYEEGREIDYTVVETRINDKKISSNWEVDYDYTVTEGGENQADWVLEAVVSNDWDDKSGGGGFSVKVNKVWKDDNDEAGARPESITVQLMEKDRRSDEFEPYGKPVELNAKNNWKHTWYDLNESSTWEVAEVEVPEGYTSSVKSSGNNFTITNTYDDTTTIPELPPPTTDKPPVEDPPVIDAPLAEAPKTGDASALWLAMTALSGTGLAGISFLGRKKREED